MTTVQTIDIRDLLEHPGTSRRVHLHEPIAGFQTGLADVPADVAIDGDLLLEGVIEGVYVTGSIAAPVRLTCARCLALFERTVEVRVAELVAREPGPEDDYRFEEDLHLDPEPIVRDAVGLELPFAPLCRPDCQGICPTCGADRNLSPCSCAAPIDPRWRALEAFGED